ERTPRRLRRVLSIDRQLLHYRVYQLAIRLRAEREAETLSRHSPQRAGSTRPARRHDHHRTGDDHQDTPAGMADGGSPEPRAPPDTRRVAYPSVAVCAALRLLLVQASFPLTRECSWHLGRARRRRCAAPVRTRSLC